MKQLSLWEVDAPVNGNVKEVIIPQDMVPPVELKESINSDEFRRKQTEYSDMVCSIQRYHECSFFEAKEMLLEYRDEQIPVKILK